MTPRRLGTRTVPADATSVREGRRWLQALLAAEPPAVREVTDDAVLLLSETLTNAICYGAGPTVTLHAALDPTALHIEVTQARGPGLPHYTDDPAGEHGRGLPILDQIAAAWGYRTLPGDRLTVWFRVETKPPGTMATARP
ncbi:ATP-binding protein [Thermomonospora umbrina]|uniref:Anti-sigma regulatory factor (Ser/Thr protein kinase) n=1 Tax=Thermomonospora umbrina TaxID=111806 RepID=A0A3D9SQX8_9ACTN|nr:ATP-binding protein [Thermomonospora umbrina]REE98218.1 anti-sigma regulatory factor (Ser/Thr protein kinase) [Thermomonospora umbrina]